MTLAEHDGMCNLCGWEGRFESDPQPFGVGQQFSAAVATPGLASGTRRWFCSTSSVAGCTSRSMS